MRPSLTGTYLMDYKTLLIKFMVHVHYLEESSFVDFANTNFSNVDFSEEEIEVLKKIESGIHRLLARQATA